MRESVPIARYSPVCNVLRQWKTSLILTYRVYRLYDKYSENSDNSTDKGESLRSPIIYSENSDNSTDKGGSVHSPITSEMLRIVGERKQPH